MDAWSLLINRCCFTLELIIYALFLFVDFPFLSNYTTIKWIFLDSSQWICMLLAVHADALLAASLCWTISPWLQCCGFLWCGGSSRHCLFGHCFSPLVLVLFALVDHTHAAPHQHYGYAVSLTTFSSTQSSFTHLHIHTNKCTDVHIHINTFKTTKSSSNK